MGSFVQLTAADGTQFPAYVAEPATPAKAAVVVIQEIFGVNAHIREVADALGAAHAYLAQQGQPRRRPHDHTHELLLSQPAPIWLNREFHLRQMKSMKQTLGCSPLQCARLAPLPIAFIQSQMMNPNYKM